MHLKTAFFCALVMGQIALPAHSYTRTLVCSLTDYSDARVHSTHTTSGIDARLKIKSLIPPESVHIIENGTTRIEGMDQSGTFRKDGLSWVLRYRADSPGVGEVKITYRYLVKTGQFFARAVITKFQNEVSTGRITGRCVKRQ